MALGISIVSIGLAVTCVLLMSYIFYSQKPSTEESAEKHNRKTISLDEANADAIAYCKDIYEWAMDPDVTIAFGDHHIVVVRDNVIMQYHLFPYSEKRMARLIHNKKKQARPRRNNNGTQEPSEFAEVFSRN